MLCAVCCFVGDGPARSHALCAVSVLADVVHLYGPGGPGGVAASDWQEDRRDAYVRAAWLCLCRGRGCAEEVEAENSLGSMVATLVAIQCVWKWCQALCLGLGLGLGLGWC